MVETDLNQLVCSVNEHIKLGGIPQGGIFTFGQRNWRIAQAMIFPESNTPRDQIEEGYPFDD